MRSFFSIHVLLLTGIITAFVLCGVIPAAFAAPNFQVGYQGKLFNSDDTAVTDGTYSIRFALYTAASGGTAVWQETQSVTVTSGLFSVLLGSVDATIADVNWNQTLYLGVKVGSDAEMTPRKKLGTVPSAFEADQLDGLDSTDFISTTTASLPNVTTMTGLATVGTITTGVWQGSPVGGNYGGTGLSGFGGTDRILYSTSATTLAATTTLPALVQSNITAVGTVTSGTWNGASLADAYIDNDITASNYVPLSQKGAANGVATLNASGKVPTSQLTPFVISDTFVVASEVEMLALSTAEIGDLAVRTDVSKTFILADTDYSSIDSWIEMLTPTDNVLSVNGQTGAVSLTTDDIAEGANQYYTDARVASWVSGQKGAANGLAPLGADSKIPTAYLPQLFANDVFVISSSSTLTTDPDIIANAQEGDVAIALDESQAYILTANPPTTLSNWVAFNPSAGVLSVNGQTGVVSLSTTNINEGTNKYLSTTTLATMLSASSPLSVTYNSGTDKLNFAITQASSTAAGYLSATDWSTFNGKQNTITGAATSIVTSDLATNRVLISSAGGKVAASATIDTTELSFLDGISTAGTTNALTYWTSAGTIGATSSPTVGMITATTTTATSTFAGLVAVGTTSPWRTGRLAVAHPTADQDILTLLGQSGGRSAALSVRAYTPGTQDRIGRDVYGFALEINQPGAIPNSAPFLTFGAGLDMGESPLSFGIPQSATIYWNDGFDSTGWNTEDVSNAALVFEAHDPNAAADFALLSDRHIFLTASSVRPRIGNFTDLGFENQEFKRVYGYQTYSNALSSFGTSSLTITGGSSGDIGYGGTSLGIYPHEFFGNIYGNGTLTLEGGITVNDTIPLTFDSSVEWPTNDFNLFTFGQDSGVSIDGTAAGLFWSNYDVGNGRFEFRTVGGSALSLYANAITAAGGFSGNGGSLTGLNGSQITTGTVGTTVGGTGLTSYAQGDLLYASAANTLSKLPKNASATRYLSNTGTSNNPAWAQIDLSNGVTGDLPFANLTQGSARSVLGVTGNATADVAAIQGTANQVLRVDSAGTGLAFGQLNLSSSAAVTGTLPVGNGGTGLATWTSGGVLYASGATTLANGTALSFDGTNLGIGQSTPTSKLDITTNSLGTTQTTSSGLALVNSTAAAAGAQQISPALRFSGKGWKTAATAASQSVDFRQYLLPVQGTSIASGDLLTQYSVNGGAYTTVFAVNQNGIGTGGLIPAANQGLLVSGGAQFNSTDLNTAFIIQNDGTTMFQYDGNANSIYLDPTNSGVAVGLGVAAPVYRLDISDSNSTANVTDRRALSISSTYSGNDTAATILRYGQRVTVSSTGTYTHNTGSRTIYGNLFEAADTGSTSGTNNVKQAVGIAGLATTTGAVTSGNSNRNTWGGYFLAVGDTNGNSNAYGVYASASGADNNYAGWFDGLVVSSADSLGTTQVATKGISLTNATAAANGAQQISPALMFHGSGWKTNATAASQSVDFRQYLLPVQGTANPSGNFLWQASINGGAYSTVLTLTSGGALTAAGGISGTTGTFSSSVSGTSFTASSASLNSTGGIGGGSYLSAAGGVHIPESGMTYDGGVSAIAVVWGPGSAGADSFLHAASSYDYAERVSSSQDLESGEAVMADPDHDESVVRAEGLSTIVGVIVARPGLLIGAEGKYNLALAGRVKVKVNGEAGPIRRGDPITLSSTPGVGMVATESGVGVYAVALESFTPSDASSTGSILAFIRATAPVPTHPALGLRDFINVLTGQLDLLPSSLTDAERSDLIALFDGWRIENGILTVKEIHADRLQIEDGILLKDRATGEYHCVYIENGELVESPTDDCSDETTTDESDDIPPPAEPGDEPDSETPPEDTASTTPDTPPETVETPVTTEMPPAEEETPPPEEPATPPPSPDTGDQAAPEPSAEAPTS